ncbi:MAG: methionyl-tRNA formyltransferase [Cytophagales bacterium]|nr:methionyl-tRNA formyltransferase [Cytophagales bacterium]
MNIVVIGRQDFGKAVLEAFHARGDRIVGVFCAPDKEGAKPDALDARAVELGLPVFKFASLKSDEALATLRACHADIGVMAYVLQFAPQEFVTIPRHGMIQYHPSLLPKYRGPSAIGWAISNGETETGLTIFRPTDGLDEGPVILQKTAPIRADATLGSVYFDYLFPLGVAAMLEAADSVVAGTHKETVQDESQAGYEGWYEARAARINPFAHLDQTYNQIRACNPAPGAWLEIAGKKVQIFDCNKHTHRTFGQVRARTAKVGHISQITDTSFFFVCNGGEIEVLRAKAEDTKKISGAEVATHLKLSVGLAIAL